MFPHRGAFSIAQILAWTRELGKRDEIGRAGIGRRPQTPGCCLADMSL
jgi:hypothetical protein